MTAGRENSSRRQPGDILDAIRRANPIADLGEQSAPVYDLDAFIAHVMAAEPRADVGASTSWLGRRRRRLVPIAVASAVLVTAGVATAAMLSSRHTNHPEGGVVCRSSVSAPSEMFVLAPGDNPIQRCGDVWKQGSFESVPAQDPPPLVACTGESTALEVVPGSSPDVCRELGLDPADTELTPQARAVIDIQDRLGEAAHTTCMSVDEMQSLAASLLSESGLTGWTIRINPPERATDICAIPGIDPTNQTIVIGARPSSP